MRKLCLILALFFISTLADTNLKCPPNSEIDFSGKCACLEGYYGNSADDCKQCPENTNSLKGQGLSYNTGPGINVSACKYCQKFYFVSKDATSDSAATCSKCENNSIAGIQQSYARKESEACDSCDEGYYWNTSDGKKVCKSCGDNGSTPSDPKNSGVDASQCNICTFNYYMTKSADKDAGKSAECVQCPPFSQSAKQSFVGSIENCRCFDRNAEELSSTVSSCQCKQGYAGEVAKNSSKDTIGCQIACGTNASYKDGKCTCNKGYYGKDASYGQTCQKCPDFAISTPCVGTDTCNTGKYGDVKQCYACIENYYGIEKAGGFGDDAHGAKCVPCPKNSYLSEGSLGWCQCFDKNASDLNWSVTECKCKYGYTGNVATSKDGPGCVKESDEPESTEKGDNNSGSSNSNNNSQSNGSNGNSGSSNNNNTNSGTSGNNNNNNSNNNNNNSGSTENKDKAQESQNADVKTSSKQLQVLAFMILFAILI
ncbi:immobilization antigen (macronuclear) [Tetrahymena thermophila SB210]|uniref:Immobilization antigen n=1 Tax=Tetrahymena thermophila (strain SB210) TaxID=312017 RepID=Q23JR5_TETTS|nr:immobilization antigen [Tetrahymena thermophila SB210]EAR96795.1 immobilization antigen [Tetrahymena thermophila SB210]|eukprot:XP_001017040.1 immobilization antigen [Tetrahymena thermophila SB210]